MDTIENGDKISGILAREIPEVFGWKQRFATLIDYLCHPEKYPPIPKGNPRIRRNQTFNIRNGRMTHKERDH